MNVIEQRKTLQEMIEKLPAPQLMMVTEYVAYLQSSWLSWEEMPAIQDQSLLQLIETICQTPFNPDNVTLPTKYMDTHFSELECQQSNPLVDPTQWDREWDQLEAQWKSERLSHETLEREQDW